MQPEHLEKMYAQLLASGLAPASVLQAHRVLSRALKVAMQRGRVARNVCALVDAPSVIRAEVEPLTSDDARAVLRAAEGIRNGVRWSVALALGLRQGEALGLPWAAVDLDAGTLRVRQALQRQKGKGLVIVEPKSAAGKRTVAMPRPLLDALRQHRTAQLEERLAAANVWQDHGLVFAQPNGRPLDPRSDHRAWRALLTTAGVRPTKLHDARHTAATVMLTMGVPARVVMQIRAQPDQPDAGHLLPRHARAGAGRGRPGSRGPVGHRMTSLATTLAPFRPRMNLAQEQTCKS
jgi:integrase